MRAVRVEESSAVGAEHLDRFLRRDRSLRDRLRGHGLRGGLAICACRGNRHGLHQLRLVIRPKVLHHALRHQQKRIDQASRKQNPDGSTRGVHPEIAQRLRFPAGNAAYQRDGERHADGGRKEVMVSQREHLRQIAHGGLGHIRLPVRVRSKRDRCVQRQVRCNAGQMLRIERKHMLDPLDHVGDQKRDEAEQKHRQRIFGPAHLVRFVDAGQPVNPPFQGTKKDVGEGTFAFEDARHVNTHRLCAEQNQHKEKEDLKPAVRGHERGSLKLFRLEKRVHKVDKKAGRHQPKKNRFDHLLTYLRLQPLTSARIRGGKSEK